MQTWNARWILDEHRNHRGATHDVAGNPGPDPRKRISRWRAQEKGGHCEKLSRFHCASRVGRARFVQPMLAWHAHYRTPPHRTPTVVDPVVVVVVAGVAHITLSSCSAELLSSSSSSLTTLPVSFFPTKKDKMHSALRTSLTRGAAVSTVRSISSRHGSPHRRSWHRVVAGECLACMGKGRKDTKAYAESWKRNFRTRFVFRGLRSRSDFYTTV
jgi:hypothetical protein